MKQIIFLFITIGVLFTPLQSLAYQSQVDWMWNNTKPSSRGGCKNFVVKAGPPKILRGRVSGRDCLTKAIKAYRVGDHEKAFGWILAGQCHDRQARNVLIQNAPKVLEYLLGKFGPAVPE